MLHTIILAAGKGTRMHSTLPKVLHEIGGKPLLEHVVEVADSLKPDAIHIVWGEDVEHMHTRFKYWGANWVEQKEQLGTGHAVMQVLPYLPNETQVLILYGDAPLVSHSTLQNLLKEAQNTDIAVLTATIDDPSGFGRIIRNQSQKNSIAAIVEDKDANSAELKIKEINSGIIATSAQLLNKYLPKLVPNNQQKEYYLTDIIALAIADNCKTMAVTSEQPNEILGINDKAQLAKIERLYQQKLAQQLMCDGVTIIDPARIDIRGKVRIAKDVTIDINAILEKNVAIGNNSKIGPNCYLSDVYIGDNVTIKANSVVEGAIIEDDCIIGPFARIRPISHIRKGAHIGNFVEVKNTNFGAKSKANHLSYLGDSIVGQGANIGAGVITCNYDGSNKYQTIIEDGVFIGSNSQLIAPVRIGKNATIGAGSTITQDAPSNKLTLARARQITKDDWHRPEKGQRKNSDSKDNK